MKILKNINLKYLILVIFTTIIMLINFPYKISHYGKDNFDWWSNEIMLADMMYVEDFGYDSLFQKVITPNSDIGYEPENRINLVYNYYTSNAKFEKRSYETYYSNLTIQRYFYNIINFLTGNNHKITIRILYIVNTLLFACCLCTIIIYINKLTNRRVATATYLILIFLTPSLIMYSKNLYWCAWSLFIPFLTSCYVIQKGYYKKNIKKANLLLFTSCFIKQLLYFEYISTIFISCMIPIIYYILSKEKVDKKNIKKLTISAICIMLSFVAISIIKFLLLCIEFKSFSEAYSTFVLPIINRILGNKTDLVYGLSAKEPLINVLKMMLDKPFIVYGNYKYICEKYVIIISLILTIINIIKAKNKKKQKKELINGIILVISLIGSFSWFVLAKPHTFIHNVQCEILWFIPYNILAITYILKSIDNFLCKIYGNDGKNKSNYDY